MAIGTLLGVLAKHKDSMSASTEKLTAWKPLGEKEFWPNVLLQMQFHMVSLIINNKTSVSFSWTVQPAGYYVQGL